MADSCGAQYEGGVEARSHRQETDDQGEGPECSRVRHGSEAYRGPARGLAGSVRTWSALRDLDSRGCGERVPLQRIPPAWLGRRPVPAAAFRPRPLEGSAVQAFRSRCHYQGDHRDAGSLFLSRFQNPAEQADHHQSSVVRLCRSPAAAGTSSRPSRARGSSPRSGWAATVGPWSGRWPGWPGAVGFTVVTSARLNTSLPSPG